MSQPSTPDEDIRRRRLLGLGLRADLVSPTDLARDITLTSTATGVDLATVVGADNLTQGLSIGLTTLRGSDVFNQRFGFLGLSALVEQTSPVLAREGVRSAVAEFLSGDPRVRRITDLQVGNPMADATGSDRRRLDVRVAFEAISGDATTIATGGVASGAQWGANPPAAGSAAPSASEGDAS